MKNAGKTTSAVRKKAVVATAATKAADARIARNGSIIPPFAHRTPNQLHASLYALK